MNVAEVIYEKLNARFNPLKVNVINQSHLHQTHMSEELPFYGQTHFLIQVQAEAFNNLTKIEQHRLVFSCLNSLIPSPVHALSIDILSY